MRNVIENRNILFIFATEIRQNLKIRSLKLQQFLYNVHKGIVSLTSRLTTYVDFWRNLGELCPLFCYSIFFNTQI